MALAAANVSREQNQEQAEEPEKQRTPGKGLPGRVNFLRNFKNRQVPIPEKPPAEKGGEHQGGRPEEKGLPDQL